MGGPRSSPEEKRKIYEAYQKNRNYAAIGRMFKKNWQTIKAIVLEQAQIDAKAQVLNKPSQEGAILSSVVQSIAKVPTEAELCAQYFELRRSGKTIPQCLIELRISPEMAKKFEQSYVELNNLARLFSITELYDSEGIDPELFIKEFKEFGSITNYRRELSKLNKSCQHAKSVLKDTERQCLSMSQWKVELESENNGLETENNQLIKKNKELKAEGTYQYKELVGVKNKIEQVKSIFIMEAEKTNARINEELYGILQRFQTANAPLLDKMLEALVRGLRACLNPSPFIYEIFYSQSPMTPEYHSVRCQMLSRELAIAENFARSCIDEASYNAVAGRNTDSSRHNLQPSISVPINHPQKSQDTQMDSHKDWSTPAEVRASLDDKVNMLTEEESKKKLSPASATAAAPQIPLIENDGRREKVSDEFGNFLDDEFETTFKEGFTFSLDCGTDGVRSTDNNSCGSGGGSCKIQFNIFRVKDVMVAPDNIWIKWEGQGID